MGILYGLQSRARKASVHSYIFITAFKGTRESPVCKRLVFVTNILKYLQGQAIQHLGNHVVLNCSTNGFEQEIKKIKIMAEIISDFYVKVLLKSIFFKFN